MTRLDFGEWLVKKRLEMGWSQRELARRMGVSNSHISIVEKGETGVSFEFCEKLAYLFSVDPEQVKRYAGLKGNSIPSEPVSITGEAVLISDMIGDLNQDAKQHILSVIEVMAERERARARARASPSASKAKAPT